MWVGGIWRGLCCVCAPAITLAWLEIEIEGADGGWAKRLPTWRYTPTMLRWLVHKDRPFTGYHVTLGLTMFATSHCPLYLVVNVWSWSKELMLLASLLLMMGLEDHLWFCFNHGYRDNEATQKHIKHFDSLWDRYGTYVVLCVLSAALECLAWWMSEASMVLLEHMLWTWGTVLAVAIVFALMCELLLMPLHRACRLTLLKWTTRMFAKGKLVLG